MCYQALVTYIYQGKVGVYLKDIQPFIDLALSLGVQGLQQEQVQVQEQGGMVKEQEKEKEQDTYKRLEHVWGQAGNMKMETKEIKTYKTANKTEKTDVSVDDLEYASQRFPEKIIGKSATQEDTTQYIPGVKIEESNSRSIEEFTYGLNPTFSETVPRTIVNDMISKTYDPQGRLLFTCTKCGKSCGSKGLNNMKQHVQTHLSMSLQCSLCSLEGLKGRYMHNNYKTENALRTHKKRCHG